MHIQLLYLNFTPRLTSNLPSYSFYASVLIFNEMTLNMSSFFPYDSSSNSWRWVSYPLYSLNISTGYTIALPSIFLCVRWFLGPSASQSQSLGKPHFGVLYISHSIKPYQLCWKSGSTRLNYILVSYIYVDKLYLCCPIFTQLVFELEFRALYLPQFYLNSILFQNAEIFQNQNSAI